jgi:dephospho-CoA kinase
VSNWPGKFVIGLTGNIATGKSVVRRMLEHLGAYSIDADALAHRAISKGAPGYQSVVDTFGRWIVEKDEEIDRAKLGDLVFNNPNALMQLEAIVHPLVGQAVDILIKRSSHPIVVIEAIKLLEGSLHEACDTIWVTDAPEDVRIERLIRKRNLSRKEALQRIHAQNPQQDKNLAADVVIKNNGSYDDLWKQVTTAWKQISPIGDTGPVMIKAAKTGEFAVQRGRPRNSEVIADLVTSLSQGRKNMTKDDVMEAFGEKAYLLLQMNNQFVGLAAWQVENLVARTTDLYISPEILLEPALDTLVSELERASQDLQCEASLVFLPPELAVHEDIWKRLGYEKRTADSLGIQAWQDAATESQPENTTLIFKQLRQDRILRPI